MKNMTTLTRRALVSIAGASLITFVCLGAKPIPTPAAHVHSLTATPTATYKRNQDSRIKEFKVVIRSCYTGTAKGLDAAGAVKWTSGFSTKQTYTWGTAQMSNFDALGITKFKFRNRHGFESSVAMPDLTN